MIALRRAVLSCGTRRATRRTRRLRAEADGAQGHGLLLTSGCRGRSDYSRVPRGGMRVLAFGQSERPCFARHRREGANRHTPIVDVARDRRRGARQHREHAPLAVRPHHGEGAGPDAVPADDFAPVVDAFGGRSCVARRLRQRRDDAIVEQSRERGQGSAAPADDLFAIVQSRRHPNRPAWQVRDVGHDAVVPHPLVACVGRIDRRTKDDAALVDIDSAGRPSLGHRPETDDVAVAPPQRAPLRRLLIAGADDVAVVVDRFGAAGGRAGWQRQFGQHPVFPDQCDGPAVGGSAGADDLAPIVDVVRDVEMERRGTQVSHHAVFPQERRDARLRGVDALADDLLVVVDGGGERVAARRACRCR